MSAPEGDRPPTRVLRRSGRHRAPPPVTIIDDLPVLNGMVEATVPCGRCEACKRRHPGDCHKPWRGYALPDPHCTACGHNPHDDECPGCRCKRRSWGWEEPDDYWENVQSTMNNKPLAPGDGDER